MISNYRNILETRYHLDLSSVTRALTSFNYKINDDASRKSVHCNRLIKDLGGEPISNEVDAEIIAKCLIEQVILQGEDYIAANAIKLAEAKLAKLRVKMPELWAGIQVEVATDKSPDPFAKKPKKVKRVGSDSSGDKKERAREVYNKYAGKPAGDIAKLIASELDITYSNAYYYVSRVFNK